MGTFRQQLSAWERGNFGSEARPTVRTRNRTAAIMNAPEASGLPAEFFSIDFDELPEIVEHWERNA